MGKKRLFENDKISNCMIPSTICGWSHPERKREASKTESAQQAAIGGAKALF